MKRDPEFPHLDSRLRWPEILPSGIVADCGADAALEAAVLRARPELAHAEPVAWPWLRSPGGRNAHGMRYPRLAAGGVG